MAATVSIARHLSTRLVAVVGLGLLLFALIAGIYTFRVAYQNEIDSAQELERHLVATVRAQSEVAVYANNALIAQGVLDGLTANPIILGARIQSDDRTFLAETGFGGQKPPKQPSVYSLYSPFNREESLGSLSILVDEELIAHRAQRHALEQTILLLIQIMITAGIMIFFLRKMLITPIARLSHEIALLQPGSSKRLAPVPEHEADELGQLVRSTNHLLDAAQQAMEDLNEANASLATALEKLADRDEAKSRFFAAASHDLRQPIHAINLFLDAMVQSDSRQVRARQIESIRVASTTLRELLESLLDISRLDAGVVTPQLKWATAESFFERLDNNFSPLALQRKLRFKLWYLSLPLAIHTDPRLLNSILANLVGNAIKYTPTGGLLVALRPRHGYWAFQVWDTGMGIGPEHLDRIYDEFYQIENPGRDRAKGLGLGLAIVRRIAGLLGYELRCHSRTDRGTCFEVILPREAVSAERSALPTQALELPLNLAGFRGRRFVVIEDDRLVAQALGSWLESCGCPVDLYRSAEDALAAPGVLAADHFIVDDQLAGKLSGKEFLRMAQQRLGRPPSAVIVTGNTTTRFIEGTEQSPWPILFKPVEPVEILSRLAE